MQETSYLATFAPPSCVVQSSPPGSAGVAKERTLSLYNSSY